jgi:RNA polymerase sigma factor (sigma-70 family)
VSAVHSVRAWDPDEDLARAGRAASGDDATLRTLIADLKPMLWKRAWAIARPDRHHAEDLIQEGLVWALRPGALQRYEAAAPLLSYLAVVAQRRMIGLVRSARERVWAQRTELVRDDPDDTDGDDPTFAAAARHHDARRLEELIGALEPELALLVRLKASGATNPEIASLLEVPVGTVKSRFARACQQFRLQLEGMQA